MKSFIILVLLIFVTNFSDCFRENSDLIAVVQVFRHGERTPLSFYPTDPYSNRSYWPVDFGQLTNEGKRQLYNLGKYTRQRYSDFLSTTYSNDDFYAQTTDVDRTHMSAQAFLAGLYTPNPDQQWNPDLKWQPIPVHPMDNKVFRGSSDCPNYETNVLDVLHNDEFFTALNKNYSEIYNYISLNTETEVTTVGEASDIYDTLFIEELFGYKLPGWTASVYPEPLRTMSGYLFESLAYNDQLKRIITGFWLHTILSYFYKVAQVPASTQKYQVFSAHDTNIATILNTFGTIKPYPQDFASTIYLELRNTTDVGIVINVWYRNGDSDIEPITISGCDFDCKLEDFKESMKAWEVDAETWSKECYSKIDKLASSEEELTKTFLKEFFKKRSPVNLYNYS